MGPPPVTVYLTTIASQPALRKRQELLLRILQAKKIPFQSYDLASDENAKKLWRRRAPAGKEQLPGILVGGKFVGTFQEFEEAVEFDELNLFLKRNEEWDEELEPPSLPTQPIGVPGAHTPMEMTPERIKAKVLAGQPSPDRKTPVPTPINKEPEGYRMSVGGELGGFGLDGVKVTQDELRDLVAQLGMGGDDAEDLVQGLGGSGDKPKRSSSNKGPVSVKPSTIVQAQSIPLAPLRPKASRASSLHKEKAKETTPAPPTPKREDIIRDAPPARTEVDVFSAEDTSAPPPRVADKEPTTQESTAEEVKASQPSQPESVKPIEQAPTAQKELVSATAVSPPIINEPVADQERSWQPSAPDNAPDSDSQREEAPKELPPLKVQGTARRMPTNRSEDTLAVDLGSPTSNPEVPYSPLTPRTLVGEQEATKSLLFKSKEPLSTPTMSEGFHCHEKSAEAEQKESRGFKAFLRRLFCM